MPDFPSTADSTVQARWHRFSAEAVHLFHLYANWLVGISWKRFLVLAVLFMIAMGLLSNIPPFRWSITEVMDTWPEPPTPPKAALPAPPEPPSSKTLPDVKIDKSGVRIEAPNGSGDDNVVISIDKNGVHITPHIRPASRRDALVRSVGHRRADQARVACHLSGACTTLRAERRWRWRRRGHGRASGQNSEKIVNLPRRTTGGEIVSRTEWEH